jgi:hypothetical protein
MSDRDLAVVFLGSPYCTPLFRNSETLNKQTKKAPPSAWLPSDGASACMAIFPERRGAVSEYLFS